MPTQKYSPKYESRYIIITYHKASAIATEQLIHMPMSTNAKKPQPHIYKEKCHYSNKFNYWFEITIDITNYHMGTLLYMKNLKILQKSLTGP